MAKGRVRTSELTFEGRTLVLEHIAKLRARKARKAKEYDDEIGRLQQMLDTGRVPQTCD